MSLMTERRPETALDVLRGARELLAVPERWTQGTSARDNAGRGVFPWAGGACCWCLAGALRRTCGLGIELELLYPEVRALLVIELGDPKPAVWQDAPGRTHAEVLDLLDRTIARAEAEAEAEQ